jgi:hypothetical protein
MNYRYDQVALTLPVTADLIRVLSAHVHALLGGNLIAHGGKRKQDTYA